jgi:hypothetical protein
MASYATNLTTFWLEGATTVTALGGGASGLGNPEVDYYVQGSNCLSKAAWTNAIKGFIVDALGTTFTVPTDGAVILFAKYDAAGSLAAKSAGGLQVIIGSASSAYWQYYIGGYDTLAFDSWIPYVIDPNTATADNSTGSPAAQPGMAERWVGILANLPTTAGPTKGNPIAIDAIRYGRCDLEYTGTGCTFSGAEAWANDPTRRLGLMALRNGSYLIQGFHSFGTAAASCTFSDSNKVLFIQPSGANNLSNNAVSTGFNRIEILNSGSSITWDNISISALGTRARGVFVHTAGAIAFTNCQFTDMDTFTLLAGSSILTTTFRRCNAITAPGSTLTGSKVLASTVAADAAALVWSASTDPNTKMQDMEFTKGTNAHHAIEFNDASLTTINLPGCTFSGFNASNGQNDSALYFTGTGRSVTVYCEDNPTYKATSGITVTVLTSSRTVKGVVVDADGAPVTGANAYLQAAAGGPFPYQDSVTIVNSGTTATVTHTGHGLATNDKVVIRGASLDANNGVFTITVNSADEYEYTMGSTPGSSPTGSITSTFVFFKGDADQGDDSNEIEMSRAIPGLQPVIGWARKSTGSPLYKQGSMAGSVVTTGDSTFTAVMVSDD